MTTATEAALPLIPTDEERQIREAVRGICGGFPEDYSRSKHAAGEPPTELWDLPRREHPRGVGRGRARDDGPGGGGRGDLGGGQVPAPDQKTYISGVEHADAVLVIARSRLPDGSLGLPSIALVGVDAPGFTREEIPMP